MKKLILFLTMLVLFLSVVNGQVIFDENFEGIYNIPKNDNCHITDTSSATGITNISLTFLELPKFNVTIGSNIYYCFFQDYTNAGWGNIDSFTFRNSSLHTNGQNALSFYLDTQNAGTGRYKGFYYPFASSVNIDFNASSVIDINITSESAINRYTKLSFIQDTGKVLYEFQLADGLLCNNAGIDPTFSSVPCCKSDTFIKNSLTNINLNATDFATCTNLTTLEDVAGFTISYTGSDTGGIERLHIDDLYINLNGTPTLINNTLPNIVSVTPIPDPVNISADVTWSVLIVDAEDPSSNIYSAFDCENDGTLDYVWLSGRNPTSFICSYGTAGNFTGVVWASDTSHFPFSNVTSSAVVEVYLMNDTNQTQQGGGCSGFVAPTCALDEVFCDDFSYNQSILCNGWQGTANSIQPSGNQLHVFGLGVNDGFDFEVNLDTPLSSNEWLNFSVEFDITIDTTHVYQFDVLDSSSLYFGSFVQWDNYVLEAFDQTVPTINNLGTFNGVQHNFLAVFDFPRKEVDYYIDGNYTATAEFYDTLFDDGDEFSFSWVSISQDFTIDNFKITTLIPNPSFNISGTETGVEIDYTYDPNFFCAVNWTDSTTPKASISNCEARGYRTDGSALSLCFPKACLSDSANAVALVFMNNILITIIVIILFILIVPLIIQLNKK